MECDRCNKEFVAGTLRVDRKGKRLVCEDCYTYITTGMFVPEKTKMIAKREFTEERKRLALTTRERLENTGEKKEKYECKSCSYKFTSIVGFNKRCPYCATEGGIIKYSPELEMKEINDFV